MEPIIIKKLTFAYPGQSPLFSNCHLNINSDWKMGLLGRNGRGKTTLMKILLHQLDYTGTVTSILNFAYFPLVTNESGDLTINTLLGAPGLANLAQWQIERELNTMGVDPTILWQPYNTLSGGEQTKVQLAALFALPGAFLLLDEPTNHLDQVGRKQVAAYLQTKQQGFILTSHDQAFLDTVIDHTLVIERHQLVLEQGNYATYFAQKKRRDQEAAAKNHQLKAEIKELRKTRQQRAQWAQRAENEKKNNAHADKGFIGAKAAKMMKKTVTTTNRLTSAIEDRQGLMAEVEEIVPLPLNLVGTHHETLLSVDKVTLHWAPTPLFQPVSFTVKAGQQVALVGPNGIGKSSLIKALFGQFTGKITGDISLAHGIKISCVRQDYATNHGTLREFAQQNHLAYDQFLNILRKLGMERASFTVPIEQMSMGQQKKVELARSLATPANLYVWDEPLNYLDTYNQDQLIKLIHDYRPPLLFVEHDQRFINAVASEKVELLPGK